MSSNQSVLQNDTSGITNMTSASDTGDQHIPPIFFPSSGSVDNGSSVTLIKPVSLPSSLSQHNVGSMSSTTTSLYSTTESTRNNTQGHPQTGIEATEPAITATQSKATMIGSSTSQISDTGDKIIDFTEIPQQNITKENQWKTTSTKTTINSSEVLEKESTLSRTTTAAISVTSETTAQGRVYQNYTDIEHISETTTDFVERVPEAVSAMSLLDTDQTTHSVVNNLNSTADNDNSTFFIIQYSEDDFESEDSFWPIAMALTIGIPTIIVLGVTIAVLYKKRMGKPRNLLSMFDQDYS